MKEDARFLIVGLGLIGGSYARGLTKAGYAVDAIDTNEGSIRYALAHGLINNGATEPEPSFAKQADIIIFALYPHVMIDYIREHQHIFGKNSLLTDVAGVKQNVVDVIQGFLREDLEFIGGLPMAGIEVSGVENSDERMFCSANLIITPTEKNTAQGIVLAKEIGTILQFKTITELDPKAHDKMIAFVSQLTHAIAVSLMTCNDRENLQNYTGNSFRDLTRIARLNEEMWSELFLLNREALMEQIDSFSAALNGLRHMLEKEDKPALMELFRHSTARRGMFD